MRTLRSAIAALALGAAVVPAGGALAQNFPERPVRLIVGFEPGGGTDILARLVAQKLNEIWKQQVIVENRPGADGSIATAAVANMDPDGYALVVVSNAHAITPSMRKLSYDPVTSFEPITMLADQANFLLVNPATPIKTVKDLIDFAKSQPGKLSFSTSGTGTSPYLTMEKFKQAAGIDVVHVPYKGSAPAAMALIAGDVQLMFGAVSTTIGHVRNGRLRAIAVTSAKPDPAAPDVLPVTETGLPGFVVESATWYGVLAPAKTPKPVVDKINAGIVQAMKMPEVQEKFRTSGFRTGGDSPEHFRDFIAADVKQWSEVIRNIK